MPSKSIVFMAATIALLHIGAEARPICSQPTVGLSARTGGFSGPPSDTQLARSTNPYLEDRHQDNDLAVDAVLAELAFRRSPLLPKNVSKFKFWKGKTQKGYQNYHASLPPPVMRAQRLSTIENGTEADVEAWLRGKKSSKGSVRSAIRLKAQDIKQWGIGLLNP